MKGLMLHCGGREVSLETIAGVETPQSTETWTPVAHATVIDSVKHFLDQSGYTVTSEAHALARDGLRYFGLMEIANPNTEHAMVAGVRNSHDKSFPAALGIGSRVFVCDNLSFSSEIVLSRRHTKNVLRDLPMVIARAVGQLGEQWLKQEQRFDAYKSYDLSSTLEVHDLLIRAVDNKVIPKSKIMDVAEQWRNPNHDEFSNRNAWSLFNAFTEVLKGNVIENAKRTQALHGMLDAHIAALQCANVAG